MLLEASAREPVEPARLRVRACLNGIDLTTAPLRALLEGWVDAPAAIPGQAPASAEGRPARKKKKSVADLKSSTPQESNPRQSQHPATVESPTIAEGRCVAALELLQWKKGIPDVVSLIPQLQGVLRKLRQLQAAQGAAGQQPEQGQSAGTSMGGSSPTPMDTGETEEGDDAEEGLGLQVPLSYFMQLALGAIANMLEEAPDPKSAEVEAPGGTNGVGEPLHLSQGQYMRSSRSVDSKGPWASKQYSIWPRGT